MMLGSVGGAPIVALFGLSAALVAGLVLIAISMALALADASLAGTRRGAGGGLVPAT